MKRAHVADTGFHVLSLCSGTGMLDEGIRGALPEARTVAYVEREAFAEALLLARMGDASLDAAPVWCGPLEDFKFREWRGALDCLTAGFPCQPWSAAGNQRGTDDDRWIWPGILDGIRDSGTPSVFLENVPGLIAGRGLNRVFGDLAGLGFDAEWCSITAADVGAAHLRKRIFILAVDACRGRGVLRQSSFGRLALGRLADGSDSALDDAASSRLTGRKNAGTDCGDAHGDRGGCLESQRNLVSVANTGSGGLEARGNGLFAPGPGDPRWRDILAGELWLAPAIKPGIRSVAHGDAVVVDEYRADQLRAIGNGVVALQAAVAFAVLTRRLLK
jgi:DNA (cytosine-5)-methyltransferase 1